MNCARVFFFIATLPTTALGNDDTRAEQQLAERRDAYVRWVADTFGTLEPTMDPRDGRRWALNHARLVLNRELDEANRFFESFGPLPGDADIYFIRFLRTLLDFQDSPRLSEEARAHIIGFLTKWPHNDLSSFAHWPPRHTENHDLMHLTIGMFAQQYRGRDVSDHVREIKQFLAWRLERGFVEWNSKCYQYHFSNPLIVLVDYAPDDDLRRGAQSLLNVMLAERAVLGVNGYLGGPSFRCRTADVSGSLTNRKVAYLMDARYDGFLPTVWLALGMGESRFDFASARVPGLEPATIHIASGNEPRLKQDEGMFFACSEFRPHPIVRALAEEGKTRKALVYKGRRFLGWPSDSLWKTQRRLPAAIYYYNTPHVSMGSVHSDGGILQSRYNSVVFGVDPSQGLRVEITLPDVPTHKRRYEARGRVVQHKNWLLGHGTLFEDGGVRSSMVGPWKVYRVGKGLCAHMELPDSYHVLQVSDLDTFADEESFVAGLSTPEKMGDRIDGLTMVAHTRALGGLSPAHKDVVLKSATMFVPRASGGQIRLAVYAGGTLEGGPNAGSPARLLYDFGKTNGDEAGWITLEHPTGGVLLPANTPIWLAWKAAGGKVRVKYQEGPLAGGGFQTARGRWESKAIVSDENKPWPRIWPADDPGRFENYWYSCYLTIQR